MYKRQVEDRAGGDADDDPGDAGDAAADDEGRHHPKAGEADGGAHDAGVDETALQLLQADDEDDGPEGLDGALEEDEEGAGDGPQIGAQDGDEGCLLYTSRCV